MARLQAQLEAVERQVSDQVWEGLQAVNLARRRADFGARKVAQALENLAAEQARYRAGRSTNQQVLQFQSDLEQAEEQYDIVEEFLANLGGVQCMGPVKRVPTEMVRVRDTPSTDKACASSLWIPLPRRLSAS